MFVTKCNYVFSGSENMAKNILRRVKDQRSTIHATLNETSEGWKLSCWFIGENVPLGTNPLIRKMLGK